MARVKQFRGRVERFADNARKRFTDPLHGHTPSQRILHRVTALAVLLFTFHSVSITGAAYDSGGAYGPASEYLAVDTSMQFVTDEEGYLTKVTPWDGQAQYLNRGDEFVTHEVSPGDTLSVIAYRYGLSINTLLWSNPSLGSGNYLKVGQTLRIPPENGYEITVKSGDSLEKLYEKYYDGEAADLDTLKARTIAINALAEDGSLIDGATLFIVGGEKPYEAPTYVASTRDDTTSTRTDTANVNMSYDPVAVDGNWVQPTSGKITQWYHAGHYAIDISDTSMPPVVAVRGGTVIRAENDGGYHGGYGNVVVVDHGETELGNCQSLYAHHSVVYVSVGDYVEAGQIIGNQGRTGRVYGKTGIHSHVELTCNGVKINPSFLFGY